MTAKVSKEKKDLDTEATIPPHSPHQRQRVTPLMISAEEVRRLVESVDESGSKNQAETYPERVAKELRLKISDVRDVRLEVSDPQWLRTPWLWPLITDDMSSIMDEHCLPGVVTRAFAQSAELLWDTATCKQLSVLQQDFVNILTVYIAVSTLPAKLICDRIRPLIRQAYATVHTMNEAAMPLEARLPYRLSLTLVASCFGLGEEAAIKKAVYAIKTSGNSLSRPHANNRQQGKANSTINRSCRYCGETVVGSFLTHNKTCKKGTPTK